MRHHINRVGGASLRRRAIALAAVSALAISACGGDDDTADPSATEAPSEGTGAPDDGTTAPPEEGTEAPSEGTTAPPEEGTEAPSEATTAPPAGDRVQGGEITMVTTQQLLSHDPQLQRTSFAFTEGPQMSALFGHLAYLKPDTGEVVLYFLESLESNDDYSVWTLKLHDGIKFSDGTPMDAEAIRYNIARAADPETGSRFQASAAGLELEVIDELTLAVTLSAPDANWPSTMVANFAAVGSPTAIQAALDAGEEVGATPVGAGPFMIKEWVPGQTMVVERNPYFADFAPGQPYLDQITFENLSDQSQQVNALTTGSAQLASPNGAGNVQEMVDADGVDALVTVTSGGSTVWLNQTRPPFDDYRARLAISLALDPVGAADAFAIGTPPVRTMFAEGTPFYNADYTFPEHDPAEAQRLFDELAAEGKPVEFTYTTTDSAAQQAFANYLVGQVAQYQNVSVEIDVRTGADYIAANMASEYQMLPNGIYFSNPIPLLGDYFLPEGTNNTFGWNNEAVNAAIDSLRTIPADDVDAQVDVWNTVQEAFLEDLPFWWVGQGVVGVSHTDDVIVTQTLNYGNYPLWAEVGYAE